MLGLLATNFIVIELVIQLVIGYLESQRTTADWIKLIDEWMDDQMNGHMRTGELEPP